MYNFEECKFPTRINFTDSYTIYNKFIPFSMLFNIVNGLDSWGRGTAYKDLLKTRKETYKTVKSVNQFQTDLDLWLNNTPINMVVYNNTSGRQQVSKYFEIIQSNLYFRFTSLRAIKNKIVGYYSLMDYDYHSNYEIKNIYFTLMVKSTHVKYVKLCILLNEPILEDCFEYWYDESLINTELRYKRLHNKILKEMISKDIPCVSKTDILDLIQPELEFKAPTISKQKQLIEEFIKEFQEEELKK
jgi:hypothetical protein